MENHSCQKCTHLVQDVAGDNLIWYYNYESISMGKTLTKIIFLFLGTLFIGSLLGFFLWNFNWKTSKSPYYITIFELEPILLQNPWHEYCDIEYGFQFSFPAIIKVGKRLIKPYVEAQPYESDYLKKMIITRADVSDLPDVTYILFEVWVMKNPNKLPLKVFIENTLTSLEKEHTEKIFFNGLEALQVQYTDGSGTVDIFIAKSDIVYNLRSGSISWIRPWGTAGSLSLSHTPLWHQMVNSFYPTLCKK